jgi:hypothetical protein
LATSPRSNDPSYQHHNWKSDLLSPWTTSLMDGLSNDGRLTRERAQVP